MPVAAATSSLAASLATRRNAAMAAVLALAAALFIAVYDRPDFGGGGVGRAIRESVNEGVNGIKTASQTVAGLFALRSPGERAAGALANLKPGIRPALHQRALPKVRIPGSPLATIVGAPPVPPIVPTPPVPLYNIVGMPAAIPPAPFSGGVPAVIFPAISPLPGGSGGIVIPPSIITTPETPVIPVTPVTPVAPITPVTPTTPAVPEPASWAMLLVGFAMIGRALRQGKSAVLQAPG